MALPLRRVCPRREVITWEEQSKKLVRLRKWQSSLRSRRARNEPRRCSEEQNKEKARANEGDIYTSKFNGGGIFSTGRFKIVGADKTGLRGHKVMFSGGAKDRVGVKLVAIGQRSPR